MLCRSLAHLGADVVQRVERRDRGIAALDAGAVAGVAAGVFARGVPVRLFRVDVEEGVAHLVGVAHRVEDEELRLRAEERLLRSEEHTSELQSLMRISYAVFCLKK